MMGLFSTNETCVGCGKTVGLIKFQIANKDLVCPDCLKKCNLMTACLKIITSEQIKDLLSDYEASLIEFANFVPTKKIGLFLEIDDKQKKLLIPNILLSGKKEPIIFNYNDIVDFELLEDGSTITKGGLGRALVGGVIFGGVGAIVGGITGRKKNKSLCNSLKIKITLNNMNKPTVYINFISSATKKEGFIYKSIYNQSQECLSTLQLICDSQEQGDTKSNSELSSADEILKFKNLLDSGAITQEEYEEKKKQLLGL